MNRIAGRAWIAMLFVLILLGGFTFFICEYVANAGKWVVFSGSPHLYNAGNIDCGVVTDADGYILLDMDKQRRYTSDETLRKSTVHWLGDQYGYVDAPALSSYSERIAGYDLLNGVYNYGDKSGLTRLTLLGSVQKAAFEAMKGYKGTLAIYNYKTGEILCAVSTPAFDPDDPPDVENDPDGQYEGVYLNRFTQSLYTPGSIFKIVTLAAAIETLPDIMEKSFSCTGSYAIGADNITCERVHGTQNIQNAFSNSCNCAFAQIAQLLGGETLEQYVEQFGVTQSVCFDGITTASGYYSASETHQINVAWSAIGQYDDLVNPASFLHFIGAIANEGRGVMPYVIDKITVGKTVTYEAETKVGERIMSATTAKTLADLMANNVSTVYGSDHFPELTVCAKTGTAEVGGGKKPNAMFAGFVRDEAYPFAFIVSLEDAGYGMTVCVPIISKVLAECKSAVDAS